MHVSIRKMEKKDYTSVRNLVENELGYHGQSEEDFANRMDAIQNHADYRTLVAEIDDEVIGFIGLSRSLAYEASGGYIRIVALAVNRNFQNSGVGTKLIESAEKFAMQGNIPGISLDSGFHREVAHRFYEKNGYVKGGFQLGKRL